MHDIGKILAHCEALCIPYKFNGRRLETDGVVLFCDGEGHIIDAHRKSKRLSTALLGGDGRERN